MITHNTQASRLVFNQIQILRTSLIDWLRCCVELARQRHALASLDDRLLQDVGLTRDDVASEVEMPFWKI